MSPAETPRSYVVETKSGLLQRNLHHLKQIPNGSDSQAKSQISEPKELNIIMTKSRTGTEIHPPKRLC